MKKISLIAMIASSMLFVACGEQTKETTPPKETTQPKEATPPVAEDASKMATDAISAAKQIAKDATKTAKIKADEIAKITKSKAEDVKAKTKKLADQTEAKLAEQADTTKSKKTTKPAGDSSAAMHLYARCAGCHGKDGQTAALGKSEKIAGQATATLVTNIKAYKAGTRNVANMGKLMQGQVKDMTDADIEAVSAYISALK